MVSVYLLEWNRRNLAWCVIVYATSDLGIDWVHRAGLDSDSLVSEAEKWT
jgi:hypothetical protein